MTRLDRIRERLNQGGYYYRFAHDDIRDLLAVVDAAGKVVDQTSMIHPAGGLDALEDALAALDGEQPTRR